MEKKKTPQQINNTAGEVTEVPKQQSLTPEEINNIAHENTVQEGAPDTTQNMPEHTVRTLSPGKLVLKRFFRSKLSIIGLGILLFLFLFSFLGPLFTSWGETEMDFSGSAESFTEIQVQYKGADGEDYIMYIISYNSGTINSKAKPSWKHLLGTDQDGRDILTRVMYGGRISLLIGIIVVLMETLIGVLLGALAGFFGKWVDQLIMRIVDIFNCLPTLPILFLASALLDGWGIHDRLRIYYLMVILTIFGWAGTARLVRGQILSLREQEFMIAADSLGLRTSRKIFRHLLPNILPQLIVSMTLGLGSVILYESTLSFLGLGVPMPYAAWGTMISIIENSPEVLSSFPHIWVPAGVCIVLAVLGFNFMGDGLRDAFDPKMKR